METLIYYGLALAFIAISHFLHELRIRSLEKLANKIIVAASAAVLEQAVNRSKKGE